MDIKGGDVIMAKRKNIPDEVIISALISHGTIKDAAAAVGITQRSLYDRMSNGNFKALYKSAKADIIRGAVFNINNQLGAAVDVVVGIMQNEDNNPAIRLQAAQTILNNANKFTERLNTDEHSISKQKESNAFDVFSF